MICFPTFSRRIERITRRRRPFRVLSDILSALGSGNLVMLTLLDLSAAFDCVDHHTLLQRLRMSYGLGMKVINWITLLYTLAAEHNKFTQRRPVRCHRQSTLESGKVRSLARSCFS